MLQEILIAILFLGALAYLGRIFYKHAKGNAGCSKNCGCDSPVHQYKRAKEKAKPLT